MGWASEQDIEQWERRDAALDIVIRAGVIKRCPVHDDSTYLGDYDVEPAYKLGNYLFQQRIMGTAKRAAVHRFYQD